MKKYALFTIALLTLMLFGCKKESDLQEKVLIAIEVQNEPVKKEYKVNEDFDKTGLTIKALYSDESSEVVTGYTLSGFDSSRENENLKINVTYKGKKAYFYVRILKDEPVYSITYVLDGGIIKRNNITSYTESYCNITLPVPSKEGRVFEGWYLSEDYSGAKVEEIVSGTSRDLVFYAKWRTPNINDIVLTDGQVVTLEQLDPVNMKPVAVIFGIPSTSYSKYIAIGIYNTKEQGYSWCSKQSYAYKYMINEIKDHLNFSSSVYAGTTSYYLGYTTLKSGEKNWEYICSYDQSRTSEAETYYPAFNYALTYPVTCEVGSSWYLPCISELYGITNNRVTLNNVLSEIGGDQILDEAYWSSCQISQITMNATSYPNSDSSKVGYAGCYKKNLNNTSWSFYDMDNKKPVLVVKAFDWD